MASFITADAARILLRSRDWKELRTALERVAAPEIADLMSECPKADRALLFRALPRHRAAEVFAYLDAAQEEALLLELTDEETRQVLAELTPDDRTALLEELPDEMTRRLMDLLSPADLQEVRELLGYPEGSVGRLMTPDYIALHPGWTVHEALAFIRSRATRSETVNILYVTDEDGRLQGAVELRRLIVTPDGARIEELVNGPPGRLLVTDEREAAVRVMRRYDVNVLPVLSAQGVLLGIVTADDVLDVAEEEATQDFHRMAPIGLIGSSLKDAGVAVLWRARVGWLLVLVFMNIFSGAGIAFFEDTLAATLSLAFFLPLLIDSGGNAGSQAATLMVRALATGEVKARDWLRLLGKEVAVSVLLGVAMAVGVALIASFRAPEVVVVVAMTMSIVVLVGSLIGMSLPFLLTRLKLDPATASAPLVTSVADIAGVLIYFSIATWYLV